MSLDASAWHISACRLSGKGRSVFVARVCAYLGTSLCGNRGVLRGLCVDVYECVRVCVCVPVRSKAVASFQTKCAKLALSDVHMCTQSSHPIMLPHKLVPKCARRNLYRVN